MGFTHIVSAYIGIAQSPNHAGAVCTGHRTKGMERAVTSPSPEKLPTLDDVADAAKVSTATVSRCLNEPAKVSEKTREKVMQAVEALGYTPHFGARALAANRTFTIGAIIPTMENAIFARGLQAFQEGLHAQGYTLLVASHAYQPEIEAEQIRALVARGADGLLLIGHRREDDVYRFLERRGVPALIAWAVQDAPRLPAIGFDNKAAMQGLAEHVLSLGHRNIGVISGLVAGNDRASGRLAGIRAAMEAHGLDQTALPVEETAYGVENGAAAFARLMQLRPRPSVVMCGNDVLAVGAMQQAREMGLLVPDDVSVTGFDNIELARIATPGLTTVDVPHREMGRRAADALIAMVAGTSAGESLELPVEITKRGSLGRVA